MDDGGVGTGRLTFRSHSHSMVLASAVRNLFRTKHGTDFDFRWGGTSVRAHRMLLEVFLQPDRLLEGAYVRRDSSGIKMERTENYDQEESDRECLLDSVLEFLYTGEVTVQLERRDQLLALANDLDFQMLVDAIEGFECGNQLMDCVKSEGAQMLHRYTEEGGDDSGELAGRSRERHLQPEKIKAEPIVEDVYDNMASSEDLRGTWDTLAMTDPRSDGFFFGNDIESRNNDSGDSEDVETPLATTIEGADVLQAYQCPYCRYETEDHDDCCRHIQFQHQELINVEDDHHDLEDVQVASRLFQCGNCDFSCLYASRLKRHQILKHSREKPFACSQCKMTFGQKGHLGRHVNCVHAGALGSRPSFRCPHCAYECSRKDNMSAHVNSVHLGIRPYGCGVCQYRAPTRSQLRMHERKHTGSRPYVCGVCGKGYSQRVSLTTHERLSHGLPEFSGSGDGRNVLERHRQQTESGSSTRMGNKLF